MKKIYYVLIIALLACQTAEKNSQNLFVDLVPEPEKMVQIPGGIEIKQVNLISNDAFQEEADYLRGMLKNKGVDLDASHAMSIELELKDYGPEEKYKLSITETGIKVSSAHRVGLFYGIQTLIQLIDGNLSSGNQLFIPLLEIDDQPGFAHRGVLLDCCRHFMSVEKVKKVIELIAYHKMNVLHWHLTEDQGWRIEIDAYPKLTQVGAWRTESDGTIHGGFYSKEEIREIVKFAAAHHVEVIPEIELPGHSSAAIAAYPWLSCSGKNIKVVNEWGVFQDIYCAGSDTTFAFIQTVLDEVVELFPSPFIHIGGDEAPKTSWENCSRCQNRIEHEELHDEHELQSYFIQRVSNYLSHKGKTIIGWDEILDGGLPKGAVVQSWRGMEGGVKACELGSPAIMSPTSHAYFDYPVSTTSLEKVYAFNPIPENLPEDQMELILGGECNLWTEHIPEERLEVMMFPRLCAMAEVLWTNTENIDYKSFESRMITHYKRLEALDVNYGFPSLPIKVSGELKGDDFVVRIEPEIAGAHINILGNETLAMGDDGDTIVFPLKGELHLDMQLIQGEKIFPDTLHDHLFEHKGIAAKINRLSNFSDNYTGGGETALIDGLLGSVDFRDGRWQAVQGDDYVIEIDLGEKSDISYVASNFLFYNNAWIFLPDSVAFDYSLDGDEWNPLCEAISSDLDQKIKNEVKLFRAEKEFAKTTLRFIRMRAYNRGITPVWHDAPGEKAWLFCDELIVR
ncbi:MAG: family 20 glycosylhydrolase [Flavobacteriales bacterium]|nr:family 20 glycosylhydrolase [Flavobacteriales bacterium]